MTLFQKLQNNISMPLHNYEIIRFKFTTPLHVGNERSDYSTGGALLQSDALYSAICHAWARLGKAEWIPLEENDHGAFTISSLFPFVDYLNDTSYFLPKPMLLMDAKENETSIETSVRKALKKVQWVDIPIFEALACSVPKQYSNTYFDKGYQTVKELPRDELGKLIDPISNKVMPRAAISRNGADDTVIYYIERYYFHVQAGLYAIVKFENDEVKSRVVAALRLLADEGIGTDRNIGHGKFNFSMGNLPFNFPEHSVYGINVGMYCPTEKVEWANFSESDINDEARAGFTLVRRGGWMSEPYNTWRKRSVYMAQPGGVFKTEGISVAGKVVNVEPNAEGIDVGHKVWRNGRSIFLPCKG